MRPQAHPSTSVNERGIPYPQESAQAPYGPIDLLHAAYGADLINIGALVEGLKEWAKVGEWGGREIGLIARAVDPMCLLNAVAEYEYGEFGCHEDLGLAMMAIGAALGQWATAVPRFFETANIFTTRVVGCKRYMNGPVRIDDLSSGDCLLLIPDPENPHDANAIRVTTDKGCMLGFIRRTIARKLAGRIERGATVRGKVSLVMLEQGGGHDDRLYIEINVEE